MADRHAGRTGHAADRGRVLDHRPRRRRPDVAGAVGDHRHQQVGARRCRLAAIVEPIPDDPAAPALAVDRTQLACRPHVRPPHLDDGTGAAAGAAHGQHHLALPRLECLGVAADDQRPRRLRIDQDRPRRHDRAALVAQPDPHPVLPIGNEHAIVVASVPAQHHRRVRVRPPARDQLAHGAVVVVDDRDGDVVVLLQREADRRRVADAVAVGRDELGDADLVDDRRLALQPLRDEEGADGRAHQQREDDASDAEHVRSYGVLSAPMTTTTSGAGAEVASAWASAAKSWSSGRIRDADSFSSLATVRAGAWKPLAYITTVVCCV